MSDARVVALGLLLVVSVVWLCACDELGVLHEWHHYYVGIALFALGWPVAFPWLGLWVAADDAYQHARQMSNPAYRSPLHRLYGVVLVRLPARVRERLP